MAKSQVSVRVPNNMESEIREYQSEQGLEHRSEAAKQLLRAGVRAQSDPGAGESLAESAMAVAGVGSIVAGVGTVLGSAWAWSVLLPFLATTLMFGLFLASIRVLSGRGLV